MIRPIHAHDDAAIARIITEVMTEFGAVGEGYSIEDPEVNAMSVAYAQPGHSYFVVEVDGVVTGGAGIAPLAGADNLTCELRKMYVLSAGRGLGLGARLLERCLQSAVELGYRQCYLETLDRMNAARVLYEKNGFKPLDRAVGCTGHSGCDSWMIKSL